ncbi:MAG: D-glycero-alpha-D-manno-heptose 7-phosphate kinase [Chlorobi bacterium OLB5]|nr:MAG: D-glycero-alpha-D-manno-heptose 7-phosphate kinase [Chlorobi bacterium OLB5]
MIISQTPLRISLSGGGTDLANYYNPHEGFVVSTAIDKYIYVILKERFDDLIYVDYSAKEIVTTIDDIKHDLVKEAARLTGMTNGFEVMMFADIPSEGSGLGSSSSLTVGLLHAFYQYQGKLVTAEQLAREACKIEIEILGRPIGKQDQYIAAYGGLKSFKFCKDESVEAASLDLSTEVKRKLGSNLLLFFTSTTRKASSILEEQNKNIISKIDFHNKIKELAYDTLDGLNALDINRVGENLHVNWELKKQLASNVSNPEIDKMHSLAMEGGALGAKISGAGGGGFLLVYCERDKQDNLRRALRQYRELPFYLEKHGSKIIFDQTRYDIK